MVNVSGDWNITIGPHVLPGDQELLFGGQPVEHFDSSVTFADLLVRYNIFPSKGQARKAGWDKPIPTGWSEWVVGKLKHHLWIWNPSAEWSTHALQ
jgi:hypothetical protein